MQSRGTCEPKKMKVFCSEAVSPKAFLYLQQPTTAFQSEFQWDDKCVRQPVLIGRTAAALIFQSAA